MPNEMLFMYLVVSDYAVCVVLLAESDGIQIPVYFASYTLRNGEIWHSIVEKFDLAFFKDVKKIKSFFFLAHRVVVYTDQPLKKAMTTLVASGGILDWAIALQSLAITFVSRKVIKGLNTGRLYCRADKTTKAVNVGHM